MKDLGVPLLKELATIKQINFKRINTLSMTFSREFGQSIAKQTKRMSVSG